MKQKIREKVLERWADVEWAEVERARRREEGQNEKTKQKIKETMLENYQGEDFRRRALESHLRGPNHYRWKEDRSLVGPEYTPEYRVWRTAVYERDGYTCQGCGQVGGQLEAHHKKPVSEYPELIYEVDNGQTLCIPCHAEKHPERYELIMARVYEGESEGVCEKILP